MIIALIISGVCTIFLDPILDLIHTPEELVSYAESYLFIILAGLPFTCLYNLFSGVLRSIGDTKAALIFLAAAITMNIALDFLFIGIIGIGTAGAAAATVLSQLFSAVCCFLYLRDNYPGLLFQKEDLGVHTELMSQSLHFGLISALQASSLYIVRSLVQGSVNTLGTPGIAAYTAATRIEGFANSFGDSGGSCDLRYGLPEPRRRKSRPCKEKPQMGHAPELDRRDHRFPPDVHRLRSGTPPLPRLFR